MKHNAEIYSSIFLEWIKLNNVELGSHQYDLDGLGNLVFKKADGKEVISSATYGGNNSGPHALSQLVSAAAVFPTELQNINYNHIDMVSSITEGNKQLAIQYGHHRQRIAQQYTNGSNTTHKRWVGACEYITENGQQRILTYLSGPEGVLHCI